MIDITIWRTPIYEEGADLTEAMTRLRKVIAQGKPYAGYDEPRRVLHADRRPSAREVRRGP